MEIKFWLNGKKIQAEIQADTLLLDLLREKECYSVKRGCETANCGLCTVLLEEKPVLSCSMLAVRVEEKHVVTLEGLQKKAEELGGFLAGEGAEQCGFCNPGFMMNIFAMEKFSISGKTILPSRKSLPLFRIYGTDQKYPEIPGI